METLELEGEVVDGKYELDRLLGAGGMGEVWRGRHRLTGRRVAVKFLRDPNEKMRKRFLREALAMGRLGHPNVIDVYDVGTHGQLPFIVMEYLSGRPLSDFITEGGLDHSTVVKLLMPAFAGIAAAHQAQMLHRDLKPDNLFVLCDDDGVPYDTKVLDFGIAKLADARDVSKLTMPGALIGTPRYLPPEALAGDGDELDERSDIFALGLILFELLTGEPPYKGKTIQEILIEVLSHALPSPRDLRPELPAGLAQVVEQAMQREPERRQASVEELARGLEPYGDGAVFARPRPSKATQWNLPDALKGPLPWDSEPPPGRAAIEEAQTSMALSPVSTPPSQGATRRPGRRKATVNLGSSPPPPMQQTTGSTKLPSNRSPLIAAGVGAALLVSAGLGLAAALSSGDEPGGETSSDAISPAQAEPTAPVEVTPEEPPTSAEPDSPAPVESVLAEGVEPPDEPSPSAADTPSTDTPSTDTSSQGDRRAAARPVHGSARPSATERPRPTETGSRPRPTPPDENRDQPAGDRPIDPFATP